MTARGAVSPRLPEMLCAQMKYSLVLARGGDLYDFGLLAAAGRAA